MRFAAAALWTVFLLALLALFFAAFARAAEPGIEVSYNGCTLQLPNKDGRVAMAAIAYWGHKMKRRTLHDIVMQDLDATTPNAYDVLRRIELCRGA